MPQKPDWDLERYIADVVAKAPPLTSEQRGQLTTLFAASAPRKAAEAA